MNKRQIFIRTLKTVVLISVLWAALLVYAKDVCASYEVGNFSGGFAQGSKDGVLWHTLTITHSGELVLNFTYTGLSNTTYVCLWKPDKSDCRYSRGIWYGPITASNIAPGTYYIQIIQGSGYGTYSIQAVFTNADDNLTESEPNDTIDTAKPFTDKVTGILGYSDYIKTDTDDWFRYEVTRSGELVLNFTYTGFSNLTHVYLWKPDKSGYRYDTALWNKTLTASNIAPGTYYIQVKQGSGYGTYTIQAVFTPDVSAPGLQDEIVCLRILSGIPVSSSEIIITDISKDGRIGMEECVYILQVVAGLRP